MKRPDTFLRKMVFLAALTQVPRMVSAQAVTLEGATASVVGWNLSGFEAISRQRAHILADAIVRLDPDVLGLVEVNPDFIAAELVADLADEGVCYRRVIIDQSASQNLAILYKCGVSVSNVRLIPGSDNGNSSLRKALAADVRVGGFDFLLIVVHLKSGRLAAERSVRDAQNDAIADFIEGATAGNEKDVLVIGDYNMITGDDQSNFTHMNPGGFLNFLSDSLAGHFSHIAVSGPGNLLDGYAVSRMQTREYVPHSIEIVPLNAILGLSLGEYRTSVSDHLPLRAEFLVLQDDD